MATVRQAIKIAEDVPTIMEYCENRINQLLADVTSMVGGKRKQQTSGIAFPYTGVCKNKYDKRKGH